MKTIANIGTDNDGKFLLQEMSYLCVSIICPTLKNLWRLAYHVMFDKTIEALYCQQYFVDI